MSISTSSSLTNIAMLLGPASGFSAETSSLTNTEANTPSRGGSHESPSTKAPRPARARSKYTHPCDACSLRKVKCDQQMPCTRCVKLSLPCTNKRQRKRSGAKLRQETREAIYRNAAEAAVSTVDSRAFVPTLPMDKILACLQIYQTWYYGVWPVVSVAHLISRLVSATTSPLASFTTTDNIQAYSLSCALSAAIAIHATFITTSNHLITLPDDLELPYLVDEAVRARNFCNYRQHPSAESLLTSFFLYVYHVNVKGCSSSAIMYLREAITMAQVLSMHNEGLYRQKSPAETHRLRKIYYLLLVTERFMSIEDDLPIILEPSIPYPSLEDEEYPELLKGFTQLVRVFSIPDKRFFDRIISMKLGSDLSNMNLLPYAPTSGWGSSNWIISVQQQLSYIKILTEIPEVQKLNILLSKYWMKSLTWHITKKNDLLELGDSTADESLQPTLPIVIAQSFLEDTKDLPLFAFESNGPGVCIKLLGLAEGLMDSFALVGFNSKMNASHIAFEYLNKIFNLISRLKNDVTLPMDEYERIKRFILTNSKSSQVQMPRMGYISEVEDSDESPQNGHHHPDTYQPSSKQVSKQNEGNESSGSGAGSPFTQITKAFCMPHTNTSKTGFGVSFDEVLTPQNFDRLEGFRESNSMANLVSLAGADFSLDPKLAGHETAVVQTDPLNLINKNANHFEDDYLDSTSTSSATSSENRHTPFAWS